MTKTKNKMVKIQGVVTKFTKFHTGGILSSWSSLICKLLIVSSVECTKVRDIDIRCLKDDARSLRRHVGRLELARGQRRTIVVVNRVKDLNKSDEEEKVQIVSRDNQIEKLLHGDVSKENEQN